MYHHIYRTGTFISSVADRECLSRIRIIELITKKIVKALKNLVPGSQIRDPE
jgi:hypothetical protein